MSGVAVTDNMLHLVVTRITNSIICNTQVILDADIIIMMPRFVFIYIYMYTYMSYVIVTSVIVCCKVE